MSKNKEIKTNAMRILDRMKISYSHYTYECEEFTDGVQVADMLGLPHEKVYKTLVAQGASREYFVFVIPIEAELRMYRSGHEKAVPDRDRRKRRIASFHDRQRRPDRFADRAGTAGSGRGQQGAVRGCPGVRKTPEPETWEKAAE